MEHFDSDLLLNFLRRSYSAVDGLWFVKLEEHFGRDLALEFDHDVWQIMPKIQARKARELLDIKCGGLPNLLKCQAIKMAAEGYEYDIENASDAEGMIIIKLCPWYEILKKTNRTDMAEPIFEKICLAEFGAWCREFGEGISHSITRRICNGGEYCEVRFNALFETTDEHG